MTHKSGCLCRQLVNQMPEALPSPLLAHPDVTCPPPSRTAAATTLFKQMVALRLTNVL